MVGFFRCDITGLMFMYLFFIYLFLCLLMTSFVHTECMFLRKKLKSHAGPVKDKMALHAFSFYYYYYYYCKDRAQTVRMHMYILIWNFVGHMFSWMPLLISCKSFLLLLRPKDLDQTAKMNMHSYADLELCWSDVSWASPYVLPDRYFTCVYLSQGPRSNCVDAQYTELSNLFDTPCHLR